MTVTPRDWLFGLELHGIKLGLENIGRLLARTGNPERSFSAVHVAGTNGKGSVLAFLDSILRAAGVRTGRFTSPHLVRLNERFLIDRQPIGDGALDAAAAYFQDLTADFDPAPTFFEINTAIAYKLFADAEVEMGLIEVGLGGRFDSTNTLEPAITAITNIGLDHTQYLGDTVEAIAFEKAGIIKPNVPVVVGPMVDAARRVIVDRAERVGAPAILDGRDFQWSDSTGSSKAFSYESENMAVDGIELGIPGGHQAENAAVATAIAERLGWNVVGFSAETIRAGLADASWPCRMEEVLAEPRVIVDVAHNPDGARALAEAMAPGSIVVLAVASDKDAGEMIRALAPQTETFVFSQFGNHRSLPASELAEAGKEFSHAVAGSIPEAVDHALGLADDSRTVYIAGSLFTAGEARAYLELAHRARPIRF